MKKPGLVAAAALVVVAVWEVVVLLGARAEAPTDADWQAARAAVARGHRPGDLIVFAPMWVDPIGRKHLGDLMTIEDAARMDETRYGRVWELSIRGAGAGLEGEVVLDERHGAVRVRRIEREAPRVLWDLRDRDQLLEVDYGPRHCVPVRAPGRLDVGVVATGRRLVVHAGLSNFRDRRDNRAFALVRVLIDGAEAARASVGSESGWVRLEAETEPGSRRVVIETSVDPERGGTPAILPVCVAAEAYQ